MARLILRWVFCVGCVLGLFFGAAARIRAADSVVTSAAEMRKVRKLRESRGFAFWIALRDGKPTEAEALLAPEWRTPEQLKVLQEMLTSLAGELGQLSDAGRFSDSTFARTEVYQGTTRWAGAGKCTTSVKLNAEHQIEGLWVEFKIGDQPARNWTFGTLTELVQQAKHSLQVSVVDASGAPVQKSSMQFWKAIDPQTVPEQQRASLWNDPATGKSWQSIAGWATGSESQLEHLLSGTYRVTAREGHHNQGGIGRSEVIELNDAQSQAELKVTIQAGYKLVVQPVDALTKFPIADLHVGCLLNDASFPEARFAVKSEGTSSTFTHLPAGRYTLTTGRTAYHPDELVYEIPGGSISIQVGAGHPEVIEVPLQGRLMTEAEVNQRWGWTAFGQVMDPAGHPLSDVEVRVATGMGTLLGGGRTTTTAQGGYRLRFAEGIWTVGEEDPTNLQAAVFMVRKPGYVVKQRTRPMHLCMSLRALTPEERSDSGGRWGSNPDETILRGQPYRIDFEMAPAAKLSVKLLQPDGTELDSKSLGIEGHPVDGASYKDWQGVGPLELLPGVDWWLTYGNAKIGVNSSRTQPFRLPEAGDYEMTLQVVPRPESGLHTLEIVSLKNTLGEDLRVTAVGDDPLARPPVDDALQARGRQILRDVAARCQLWLSFNPQPVAEFSYAFHLGDKEPQNFRVEAGKPVPGVVRHGISHASALNTLVHHPDLATFRAVDIGDEKITLCYVVSKRIPMSAGNGVQGTWRGFFSGGITEGTITIDAKRLVPLEHHGHGRDTVAEYFSQYHEVVPGQWAPLAVEVYQGGMSFQWTFQAFDQGLWLFANSYEEGQPMVARLDTVTIQGQPAAPKVTGEPRWMKTSKPEEGK